MLKINSSRASGSYLKDNFAITLNGSLDITRLKINLKMSI